MPKAPKTSKAVKPAKKKDPRAVKDYTVWHSKGIRLFGTAVDQVGMERRRLHSTKGGKFARAKKVMGKTGELYMGSVGERGKLQKGKTPSGMAVFRKISKEKVGPLLEERQKLIQKFQERKMNENETIHARTRLQEVEEALSFPSKMRYFIHRKWREIK